MEIEVISHREEVEAKVKEAIEAALLAMSLKCEEYAVKKCPVDTGRLRNSITHEVYLGEECAVVGTNVEYAGYVEFGTRKQTAQPYLKPALVDHVSEYKEISENILSSVVK